MAWSCKGRRAEEPYGPMKKASTAIRALLKGRDPLLEVAIEGLRNHSQALDPTEREGYMLRFTLRTIRKITEDAIDGAGAARAWGDDMGAACILWEACNRMGGYSNGLFSRLWEHEGDPIGDGSEPFGTAQRLAFEERREAMSRLWRIVETRIDEIIPPVPEHDPDMELQKAYQLRYRELLVKDKELRILNSAIRIMSGCMCAD